MITQAVIVAGGAGTRLKPFTLHNPKPMIPLNNKPFLEYLLLLLQENGIKEVVILTGYLGEKIQQYFKEGRWNDLTITYSHLPFLDEKRQEIKSGPRVKNATKLLHNQFLLLYCDNYWPLQIKKLTTYFRNHPSDVLATIFSNKDHSTKNNMLVDSTGYVSKYDPSRTEQDLNGVDAGYFIMKRRVLKLLSDENVGFETILPKLIEQKKLSGFLSDQKYYSIGDMNRVPITEKFLVPKKVIFLDRDGVINQKAPKADYIKDWKDFKFLPQSIEAIEFLNKHNYSIYVISNQAGIARGMMTEETVKDIHSNMIKELAKYGAKVDDIYYCPHGWDEGCGCRKPKPGLLLKASEEHHFDLTKAVFIGDDIRDKEAGDAAGCKTILVTPRKNLFKIVKTLES